MPLTSITARLGLDTSQFSSGITTARANARSFASSTATSFVAAAGVAGMGAMVSSAIQLGNELTILSQRAGISVQRMQELAHGAQTVGMDAEGMSSVLLDINDRLGDFYLTGAGPMVDFFEQVAPQVGVTADMFRDLNSDEALQLFVDTMDEANLSQAEMTMMMESVSSEGTRLLPLLQDGGEAMNHFAQEAHDMGLVMSDETAAGLTEASREFAVFKQGVITSTAEITANAIPVLSVLGNTFQFVADILGAGAAVMVAALTLLGTSAMIAINPMIQGFQVLALNVEGVWHAMNRDWQESVDAFAEADTAAAEMSASLRAVPDDLAGAWTDYQNSYVATTEVMAQATSDFYNDSRIDLGFLNEEEEAAGEARIAVSEEVAEAEEERRRTERAAHLASVADAEALEAANEAQQEAEDERYAEWSANLKASSEAREAAADAAREAALEAAQAYRTETLAALDQREAIENRMGIVLQGGRDDIARMLDLEERVGETPRARRENAAQARRDEITRRREMTELVQLQREQREQYLNMSSSERDAARQFQATQRDAAEFLRTASDEVLLSSIDLSSESALSASSAGMMESAAMNIDTSLLTMSDSTEGLSEAAVEVGSAAASLAAAAGADVAPEWLWLAGRQDQIIEHLQSIDEEVNRNP